MTLIKCPECGKEVSDRAAGCPSCGYPFINGFTNEEKPRELSPEEQPKLFECYKCGRPLPVDIDECIYCGYEYKIKDYDSCKEIVNNENFTKTGLLGRKKVICPRCGSKKIQIKNDIPLLKKTIDIISFGTVTPITKSEYRNKMEYHCKICGTHWSN